MPYITYALNYHDLRMELTIRRSDSAGRTSVGKETLRGTDF